jgi:hypothetical protein
VDLEGCRDRTRPYQCFIHLHQSSRALAVGLISFASLSTVPFHHSRLSPHSWVSGHQIVVRAVPSRRPLAENFCCRTRHDVHTLRLYMPCKLRDILGGGRRCRALLAFLLQSALDAKVIIVYGSSLPHMRHLNLTFICPRHTFQLGRSIELSRARCVSIDCISRTWRYLLKITQSI